MRIPATTGSDSGIHSLSLFVINIFRIRPRAIRVDGGRRKFCPQGRMGRASPLPDAPITENASTAYTQIQGGGWGCVCLKCFLEPPEGGAQKSQYIHTGRFNFTPGTLDLEPRPHGLCPRCPFWLKVLPGCGFELLLRFPRLSSLLWCL